MLHTSGTTSRPKRVPLRHHNLAASVSNIIATYELGPEDVSLCVMPLFHVHGLVASALATFASGGTVVAPDRFTPLGFWPLMQAHRPTWFTASPTPHQLVLARLQEDRPAGTERLRFVRSCSAALSPAQMALMEQRFGVPVLEAYGMTEASHQMASNPLPPEPRLAGSVGRGTGVDIAVFDEAGAPVASGVSGEVVIRGVLPATGERLHEAPRLLVHLPANEQLRQAAALFRRWLLLPRHRSTPQIRAIPPSSVDALTAQPGHAVVNKPGWGEG